MAPPAIYRLADRLAPPLRRAFLKAIAEILKTVTRQALLTAIEAGDRTAILAALKLANLPTALAPAAEVVRQVITDTAEKTFTELAIDVSFTIVNPAAVRAAQTQGAALVTQVTRETQAAIRALVARAYQEGIPPRELAKLVESQIGLTTRQTQAALNYRATLADAGLTEEALAAKVDAYAAKLLHQRAELIARTETIAAANAGQRAAWETAAEQGLIDPDRTGRVWQAASDSRTCDVCDALDGQVVGFGEPFMTIDGEALDGPPAHPNCRCSVSLTFDRRQAA